MHELAATQGILDIALKHAEAARASRIVGIHLVLGQLSTMVDDSIQAYWDLISAGTAAQSAVLHFQRVPLELECLDCGCQFAPGDRTFDCPRCQGARVRVLKGTELYVEAIDVE